MSLPIKPRLLNSDDFNNYTRKWEELLSTGTAEELQFAFTSTNKRRINYAYLSKDELGPLLENWNETDLIKTKFLLVPDGIFSLALIHTDADGAPLSDYYLAGVADLPATLNFEGTAPGRTSAEAMPAGMVPTTTAEDWIKEWNQPLAELDKQLFDSPLEGVYLKGYTFMVTDFTSPWKEATEPEPALWLNFDVKPAGGDIEFQLVFSTIVDRNTVPTEGVPGVIKLLKQESFYDISKPCPPCC